MIIRTSRSRRARRRTSTCSDLTFKAAPSSAIRNGVPAKILALLEKELRLIRQGALRPLFSYRARHRRLGARARPRRSSARAAGSAANSVVCFCLGVTSVDPTKQDVLFERFISEERSEPPDIDVDFEHERREEVMQYVYRTLWPPPRGDLRHRHPLSSALGHPRRRQGAWA